MKKILLTLICASCSLYILADESPRKPMQKGSFSVGVTPVFRMNSNTSDPGNNKTKFTRVGIGIPVRYFPAKNLGFEAVFGIVRNGITTDFGNGENTTTVSGLDLGIGIFRPTFLYAFTRSGGSVVLTPKVQVNIFSGNSKWKTPNQESKEDAAGVQVGAFLGAEWFPQELGTPQLSLQAAIGLTGLTISEVGNDKDRNSWAFNPINPQAGALNFLNATFGFHYYFF